MITSMKATAGRSVETWKLQEYFCVSSCFTQSTNYRLWLEMSWYDLSLQEKSETDMK